MRALLLIVFYLSLVGCVYYPPMMPMQPTESQGYTVQEGSQFLNSIADPTLPAPAYNNCMLGQYTISGAVDQSSQTYSGSVSQTCDPTPSRINGVNVRTTQTRMNGSVAADQPLNEEMRK